MRVVNLVNFKKKIQFKKLFFVLVLLLVVAWIPGVSAAQINVPGDYSTIQAAIDAAVPGDTIIVATGTYHEEVVIDKQLTLTGDGWPVIDGTTLGSFADVVTITDDGVRFEGFDVRNSQGMAGVNVEANNAEIVGNRFSNNAAAGIELTGASGSPISGATVSGNEVTNNHWYGIYLRYADNNVITGNNASSNVADGGYTYAIYLGYSNTNVISQNTVSDNEYWGIYISDSQGNEISKNTIRQNGLGTDAAGISLDSADNTTVIRNTLNGNDYGVSLNSAGQNSPNLFYLNSLLNSVSGHVDIWSSSDTSWESPSEITYTYDGSQYTRYLGNYWDTYTGSDNDGDGIGDTEIPFSPSSSNYDWYPLVEGQASYITGGADTTPPGPVTGLGETATTPDSITWGWTDPIDADFSVVKVYLDGVFQADVNAGTETYQATGLAPSTGYEIGTRTVDSIGNENPSWVNDTATTEPEDQTPPASVSGLTNTTYVPTSITWTWTDPADADFVKVMVYLDGAFRANVTAGVESYTATGLAPETSHEIGTRTVDASENINPAWANSTATTAAAESHPPTASFTFSPASPGTNELIQFTDTSVDAGGTITAWAWEFGDGGTADVQHPTHSYALSGFYKVNLTVTDDTAVTDTATTTLFVHAAGPMTITVPDDFGTIQAAVNAARDGDTVVVHSGTYPEQVVVNRSITLAGEGMPQVQASGGPGFAVTSPSCTLEGFAVTGGTYGIRVLADGARIEGNLLTANGIGILVLEADGVVLFNNTCEDNAAGGISLALATGGTIFNNTCTGNAGDGFPGIYLDDSSGNELYCNDLDNIYEYLGIYRNAAEAGGDSPSSNLWYNATLGMGNRYSDYYGPDENGDGIGDEPYDIYEPEGGVINADLYPLMPTGPVLQPVPTFSGIAASDITNESVTISWTIGNAVSSNNRVLYGTDSDLIGAVWSAWDNTTTAPSIPLSGLISNTTYHYRCYSERADDATRNATSGTTSFTTPERLPMVITVDDDNGDIPVPPANFGNITDALAASMDGDTILVYAGNYSGYHEVATQVNLTGIGWPEVSGNPDDTFSDIGDVFALRSDGCILDGFVIRDGWWNNQSGNSATTDSAAVRIGYATGSTSGWSYGSTDDTIVRNNRIEDAKFGIIANSYSNNNTFRNNTINATYYGVWLNYARNTLFANNTVTNNYYWVLHNTYRTTTTANYATNNRIEYNTFDTDGWTPFGYDDSYGREVEIDDTGGNVLSHNTLLNQTYIRIQGDGNTIEENDVLGPCEYHFAGIDLAGDGNIVRNNTVRDQKFGILLQTSTDNLQMSGNTITGCTYGFGFGGEIGYAGSRPSRNLIDTTNTVEGAPVYWIVGAAGEVYNYSTLAPAPGYLALIGCSDVRVEDFYLEKNAQSFLIHRSQNVTLDAVTAHGNAFQGVLIGDSSAITIRDSVADSNGEDIASGFHQAGIWATNTSSSRILDSNVTANNPSGIYFQYSCPDNLVAGSTITNNGHYVDSGGSFGIRNYESVNSNLTVAGCTIGNTFAGRQGIGLANYGGNSLIYNNKFFGHTVENAQNWGAATRWNVTPSPGTNIIGGPWIAGNSWDDYAGEDQNGDGLGDTLLPYATGGGTPGGDHHPLLDTFVPDEVPPVIVIHAPAAGAGYPAAAVPLEVSTPDADVAAWWYSLDAAANVTFIPNTTLPAMSAGAHTLRIFAADTSGNENSSSVTFTATVDTTPPALYVTSPEENATYAVYDVPLAVWSPDHDVFSWWYSLDGAANVTFTPNTTLPVPANGNHSVAVFVDDIMENTNTTTVNFTVNATGPAPEPTPTPTPRIDTGDDTPEPLDYPLPFVEEPAFLITILTPDAGRTVDRQTEVTYSSTHPLARAYYQLDDGPHVQVSPGRGIPVGRLTLGTHEITVTGVDFFGRYGRGSVSFEVIPLAIGEREPIGTTAYPDDAAVAFTGRPVSYTLSFEVETGADEAVSVYLNRQLAGMPGSATTVVSSGSEPGALLQNVSSPSSGVWTRVTIPVPADRIVPGSENVISFVHSLNPARTEDLAAWHIRNVAIVPDLPASAPSIRVLTPDHALGPGDEMMVWVEIAGVAPGDRFTAMVYLAAPDGTLISFPGGSGNPAPLNDAYVRGNHYGRLPGSLVLTNTDLPGTYRLVATLEPEGAGVPVALSSAPVFFSTEPAVRLYLNRDMVSDGMPLRVTHAVTGGAVPPTEATLVITMERPDGTTEYLPSGTGTYASRHYAPLPSAYETVLDETINGGWEDGTYVVRSMLYDRTDTLAAQDSVTFTVSRQEGTLTLSFPYSMDEGMAATSRIWLIDAVSLATVAEQETGTPHDEVAFIVPAGTYWYGGQMTTRTGDLMVMPVTPANRVSIGPGEDVQRQVAVQPAESAPLGEVIA